MHDIEDNHGDKQGLEKAIITITKKPRDANHAIKGPGQLWRPIG